jgi:hypothetical protein
MLMLAVTWNGVFFIGGIIGFHVLVVFVIASTRSSFDKVPAKDEAPRARVPLGPFPRVAPAAHPPTPKRRIAPGPLPAPVVGRRMTVAIPRAPSRGNRIRKGAAVEAMRNLKRAREAMK